MNHSAIPSTSVAIWIVLALVATLATLEFLALRLRGRDDNLLLTHLRLFFWLHARLVFSFRVGVRSEDPVPQTGALILVANHRSGADPVLLSILTRRRVRFLIAREVYENPWLGWLFRSVGCIAVNRDGKDLSATKQALRALQQGDTIGVFPQGGIRDAESALDDAKGGVALLALKTGAPVLPFYISGTPHDRVLSAFVTPCVAKIFAGEPIRFTPEARNKPTKEEVAEVTRQVLASIAALRPESPPANPTP